MHSLRLPTLALIAAVAVAGCDTETVSPTPTAPPEAASFAVRADRALSLQLRAHSLDAMNASLAGDGAGFAVARAEYVLAGNAPPQLAQNTNHVVFASNRTLRLSSRWVPGDTRRNADGNRITHIAWDPWMIANWGTATAFDANAPVDASLETWEAVTCTSLDLVLFQPTNANPSGILGGNPFLADISTVGFLPGFVFDVFLGEDASQYVLGVTFTFVWGHFDGDGNFHPSDIDGDGRNDTAFKEVWYNDAFEWSTDGAPGTEDVETVALHENGHALELGHFGDIHATWNKGRGNDRPGTLHVSPRAVMNAVILGTLREPLGTDNAAYCSNFGSWPE